MTFQQKRIIFILLLLFVILSGPITVLNSTNLAKIEVGSAGFYNLIQRILGLTAFSLVFIQILSGSLMKKIWVQMIGGFGLNLHITLGILTLLLIILHPLMYLIIGFQLGILKNLIPIDLTSGNNLYIISGMVAFILIILSGIAAYFRTQPFFRRIWRKIHFLNYLIFLFIVLHATGVGTDFMSFPFVVVYYISVPLVILSLGYRVYGLYQTYGVN